MMYGIEFTVIDLLWITAGMAAITCVAAVLRLSWIRNNYLVAFLVAKLLVGCGFSISAILTDVEFDAAGYFNGGSVYRELLQELVTGQSTEYLTTTPFWWVAGNATDRFTSLTAVFLLVTGGSFIGATMIACLLGAVGQLLVFRFFRERFPFVREIYLLPILFHPSLMLWSGMLLKDSMGIFALGGVVFSLHRLLARKQLGALVPLLCFFYIIFLFRSFIVLPMVAFFLFMLWDTLFAFRPGGKERSILKGLFLMASGALCVALLWILASKFGQNLVDERREGAAVFSRIEAGSSFENVEFSMSPAGAIALSYGIVNSLFRPFPWDVAKPIQAAAAVENIFLLCYVGVGFRVYFRKLSLRQRESFSGLFWGMIGVALIVAAGVGLFASNSGTISRYRIPMVPFLVAVPSVTLGIADYFRRYRRPLSGLPIHGILPVR